MRVKPQHFFGDAPTASTLRHSGNLLVEVGATSSFDRAEDSVDNSSVSVGDVVRNASPCPGQSLSTNDYWGFDVF